MKLIIKAIAFISLNILSLFLGNLDAKSFEFVLDHQLQTTFNWQVEGTDGENEKFLSTPEFYCQSLTIDNLGQEPIKNCFPYVNVPPNTSLKRLATKIAKAKNPLLALHCLWRQSLMIDEQAINKEEHPLDLLLFKGVCSRDAFSQQFIHLCYLLGIETRQANIYGKTVYDFGFDQEWSLLDLTNDQMYLGLNNEKLVSSEEIMDDPFLALRTKHDRRANQIDFKESWKQLAHFEIMNPISAIPVVPEVSEKRDYVQGFDLYPTERLHFKIANKKGRSSLKQYVVEQSLNLQNRGAALSWSYDSPFPIQHIANRSATKIWLVNLKTELKPGEVLNVKVENLFQIQMEFDERPKGELFISGICTDQLFPSLVPGKNQLNLGTKENLSVVRFLYEVENKPNDRDVSPLYVINTPEYFDFEAPHFKLHSPLKDLEKIWWQIGFDPEFQLIPPNFDQIEPYSSLITLPPISETFLNEGRTYYFRVKGLSKDQWSEWSETFAFSVNKPPKVEEVEFDQIDDQRYELNWERFANDSNEPTEYLVFGSNSLDFIPSIYCEKQINAFVNGKVTEEEVNDNLIATTTEPKLIISGGLAYYRIIARQRGQLSVPSSLIHIYDQDLIQPRNVLQLSKDREHCCITRSLFPSSYPWIETSLPHVSNASRYAFSTPFNTLLLMQNSLPTRETKIPKYLYEFPEVPESVWEEVRPHLLPQNHPAWPKLNRIFCKTRATLNSDAFRKAGFTRHRPGRWSRVSASSHAELKEYFIKAYCDSELGIIYDWKKWLHRIKGAEMIRECIRNYNLSKDFKVPHKWIYPLPKFPAPVESSRYYRKNFILVTENMRIEEHKRNEKLYKTKITSKLMDGLYTILQVCGLYDSVYVFNMPFCSDGRIAIIDTEYHHKWPVPFQKLMSKFSKNLQPYWGRITFNGGAIPNGVNEHNPPRMDRRDVIRNSD